MVECLVWDQDAAGSSPVASIAGPLPGLKILSRGGKYPEKAVDKPRKAWYNRDRRLDGVTLKDDMLV